MARAKYAAKGWDYYQHNPYFWAKMAAFAIVGMLSIPPTIAFIRWKRALKQNPQFAPDAGAIAQGAPVPVAGNNNFSAHPGLRRRRGADDLILPPYEFVQPRTR